MWICSSQSSSMALCKDPEIFLHLIDLLYNDKAHSEAHSAVALTFINIPAKKLKLQYVHLAPLTLFKVLLGYIQNHL